MSELVLEKITSGIYKGSTGICNRSVITAGGHALVIDSGISATEGISLRAAADKLLGGGDLTLFNTHPHGDHVFGNQAFSDKTIIAQQAVRDTMQQTGLQTLEIFKQRSPEIAATIGDVDITLPNVTFQDKLTIFVGEIAVELIHYGVAHSPSDSVAWIPALKTLITGDLLFNDLVPATPPGGNVAHWINILKQLKEFDAQHVIPGHGPVKTPQALDELLNWFTLVQTRTADFIQKGGERAAAIARLPDEIQAIAPRKNAERLTGVIGLVYDELTQAK